ncbi:MAG: hypothetical protein IH957_11605 [Chloroflexi bacterium]|nr:hypothetical protein [Chloroflexota bacterium]
MSRLTGARLAVTGIVIAAIFGATLYLALDSGGGQQVVPDGPVVEGRIRSGSVGILGDGSHYLAVCESDAYVRVERDTIIKILEHGDRPEIKVGDKIDHDIYAERSEEFIKERGYPATTADLYVYRDEEGIIRALCPPESTVIIDGVSKTLEEWQAEGKIPQR